jgi:signal transduction histidine kinase
MKIRTRLTILFTCITAAILLAFASVIYLSASKSRENEFYVALKTEAITKANLFFDARVETKTLQTIYRNNRKELNVVEAAIYDSSFSLLYHDAVEIDFVKETKSMIDEVLQKREIRFYQKGWQVVGLAYSFEHKHYVVTAAAYDRYGYNKLYSLRTTILFVFAVALLLSYLCGILFSRKTFSPVQQMIGKAKNISATNLDLRLDTGNNKDELSELAGTFNEMLDRLSSSFDAQKHFVSNISHELRTPLAAIITELELSQNKQRSLEEYKAVIQQSLTDARKLARLSNSLLDFSKASYDPSEISFKEIRLDELLLDAQSQVQKVNPEYDIDISFEKEFEEDDLISARGNEYLLKTAFANLMENGCKFSPQKQTAVAISYDEQMVVITFTDKGIGIAAEDLPHIYQPFYRGANKAFVEGHGIGLPLTYKIIRLHRGIISVSSVPNEGSTFTIRLPHL